MELIFEMADEVLIVKVKGHSILFSSSKTGLQNYFPFEALKLNEVGILKEFPDLKDSEDNIKHEAIKRFKKHIKNLGGEEQIKDYLEKELSEMGYSLRIIKKEGFRPIRVK